MLHAWPPSRKARIRSRQPSPRRRPRRQSPLPAPPVVKPVVVSLPSKEPRAPRAKFKPIPDKRKMSRVLKECFVLVRRWRMFSDSFEGESTRLQGRQCGMDLFFHRQVQSLLMSLVCERGFLLIHDVHERPTDMKSNIQRGALLHCMIGVLGLPMKARV